MRSSKSPFLVGAAGKVWIRKIDSNLFEAAKYYRLSNGVRKKVSAQGESAEIAKGRLVKKEKSLLETIDHTIYLTPSSTISDLFFIWLCHRVPAGTIRESYLEVVEKHIIPKLGSINLKHFSNPRFLHFLSTLGSQHETKAKEAIVEAVEFAESLGIMTPNVLKGDKIARKKGEYRSQLTDEEIQAHRLHIREWSGGNSMGPPRGKDLLEVIDVCIGSAAQIGEILALRWKDIDVDFRSISITGTIGDRERNRIEWKESDYRRRTITVAPVAIDALRRQWCNFTVKSLDEPVFPARTGGWRTTGGMQTLLLRARGDSHPIITFGALRNAAASRISERYGGVAAEEYLGYPSTDSARRSRGEICNNFEDHSPPYYIYFI